MLTAEQIEKMQDDLETANTKQSELKSSHDDTRTKIQRLRAEIKSNDDASEKLRQDIRDHEATLQEIASEHNPLWSVIDDIEKKLAADAWNKSLEELVNKQVDFYVLAERELQKIQDELGETVGDFVEFIDPATALQNIKKIIDGSGYSQAGAILAQGSRNYSLAIKDLCERKLRAQPIDLTQGAIPVDLVRGWLRTREVVTYWKKS